LVIEVSDEKQLSSWQTIKFQYTRKWLTVCLIIPCLKLRIQAELYKL